MISPKQDVQPTFKHVYSKDRHREFTGTFKNVCQIFVAMETNLDVTL